MGAEDEGQGQDDGGDAGEGTGQGEGTGAGDGGRTFTQSELDKIVGRRAKTAETAARTALLAELGVEDLGGLKGLLEEKRKNDEAAMTEAERARADAQRAKAEAEAERSAAQAERIQARLSLMLLTGEAPVQTSRLDDALELAQKPLREAEGDEDDRIAAAVDRVRERFPEWFASAQGEGEENGNGSKRTGTPPPPARTKGQQQGSANSTKQQAKTLVDRWKENRPKHDPAKFGNR